MTAPATAKPPFYWRALRLQHVRPNGWQRAMLVEGVLTVAIVLTLADVATAWTLVVLPVVAALIVKGHDLLAAQLRRPSDGPPPGAGTRTAPPPRG